MKLLETTGILAFALLHAASPALPQGATPPVQRPSQPEKTFAEPFSSIAGLRELGDGRVLVSDRLEKLIKLIDFESGELSEVGRAGQGPGEYQTPGDLYPLPADSTLLVDFGNMRMTVITPEGALLMESSPLMRPDGLLVRPSATDSRGRVYFGIERLTAMMKRARGGPAELADSLPIARWDRTSETIDTVGMRARRESGNEMKVSGGSVSLSVGPFASVDAWGVAPDGRVAIARPDEYHIELRLPDGTTVKGPVVPYQPVPVTREDKEAWADRLAGARVSVMSTSGGERSSGAALKLPRPDIEAMDWPEVKPPFPREAVKVTPGGEVWVQRYGPQGASETYDVFDSSARRVRQVVLPEGRQLMGFGRGVLYAVRTDDDDLQWLELYRR